MTVHEVVNGQLVNNVVNTVHLLSADTTFKMDAPVEESRQYIIDIATGSASHVIDFQGYGTEHITLLDAAGGVLPTLEINSRYIIMLYEVAPSQFNFTVKKVEGMVI